LRFQLASAQKELIPLATISILTPLVIGLVLQVEALGGFLVGVIPFRSAPGGFPFQCRWRLGQCQKSIEDEPRDSGQEYREGF